MSSRRKATIILLLVLVAVLFFLFAYLFRQKPGASSENVGPNQNCLIFQGEDSSKPCYVPGWNNTATSTQPVGSATSSTTVPVSITTSSSTASTLSPAAQSAAASCDSSVSIENIACVKSLAVQAKDASICSAIIGAYDKNDCLGLVSKGPQATVDISAGSLKTYDFSSPAKTASSTSSLGASQNQTLSNAFSNMLSSLADAFKNATDHPDPRFTAEGFYQRMAANAKLALYTFSEYQVRPGTSITAIGSGFSKTGNTLFIGGNVISNLPSSDGTTLSFVVPSLPDGQYEGWVENDKGTSRKSDRKIFLFITQNPAARPLITGISPENPTALDTITFTGTNLSSSVNAFTTLGPAKFNSAGGSFSLRVADLQYYPKIKDALGVKGRKVSFFIVVQNENGISKDPFIFNVQF